MKWFEKEYKKRFENESSLEGIESGSLWDQISNSIPQNKPTKKIPYWKLTISMVALISVILSLLLLKNKNIEKDNHLTQTDIAIQSGLSNDVNNISEIELLIVNDNNSEEENHKQNFKPIQENIAKLNTEALKINTKTSVTTLSKNKTSITNIEDTKINLSSDQLPPQNLSESNPSSGISLTKLDSESASTKKNSSIDTNFNVSEYDDQNESFPSQVEEVSLEENKISLSKSKIFKGVKARNILEIHQLTFLKSILFSNNRNVEIPDVTRPNNFANKKKPWAININANTNFFNLKYKDDTNTELFASEANDNIGPLQVGNGFGLNLEYQLNKSWSVSLGMEYNNYENKLSTVLTSGTTVLDSMQKIRKAINIRTVNHHNKLSTLSIPLDLTYDYKISHKWSIGTSVGASYSIVSSQRGRILGRNQIIIDYSDTENNQFSNFGSFRVNTYIRYRFNNQLSINFNPGISFQNHGNVLVQELKQSSRIYSLGMGLRYKI